MFTRILIAAPLAFAVSAAFIGAAIPAYAATAATCTTTPTQLRAAASTATVDKQKAAMILIATGERLCAADANFEAGKKFAAAAHALGVDLAALSATTTASAQ
jgi:hypothetical protein